MAKSFLLHRSFWDHLNLLILFNIEFMENCMHHLPTEFYFLKCFFINSGHEKQLQENKHFSKNNLKPGIPSLDRIARKCRPQWLVTDYLRQGLRQFLAVMSLKNIFLPNITSKQIIVVLKSEIDYYQRKFQL